MCECANTLLQIMEQTNVIRKKNGMRAIPYAYVLKGWHDLLNNYTGTRNPYWADRKIGSNYVFSEFKMRKIAEKLSVIPYRGRANSIGYTYWWKAA